MSNDDFASLDGLELVRITFEEIGARSRIFKSAA